MRDKIREILETWWSQHNSFESLVDELSSLFPATPPDAPLIQGYTAEQWQEIIDGGYLCEFRDSGGDWIKPKMKLGSFEVGKRLPFITENDTNYPDCRPAQIKGVMRPIWVEPVDGGVMCCFFDSGGFQLHNKNSRASYSLHKHGEFELATKYIEL